MATKSRPPSNAIEEEVEIIEATIEALTSALPSGLTTGQIAAASTRFQKAVITQPVTTLRAVAGLGVDYAKIALGKGPDLSGDRRFADESFEKNPLFRRLAQTHAANEKAVEGLIDDLDLDDKSRLRAKFVATILTSSLAPTNNLLGNPAAMKKALETNGRSLVDGLRHALYDLRNNGGMPSMVDTRSFVPGETVAATPGSVVFANPVLELIQYSPSTAKVRKRPVLIIPPQINKYYVLDLAPERSLIEHLVNEGQQVFCISFANPGPDDRHWGLDTYLSAIMDASDAAMEISGSKDLNMLGVCAGGITLAALLGHLAEVGDTRANSASFLVTIMDWEVPSTLGTFVSGPMLAASRRSSQVNGILDGNELARVFAWLRPNDLIWNYWVNNYLMGRNPPAFDVLSWNVDSTNLPAQLHSDFMDIASENTLVKPNHVTALDTPIDLGKVECDSFVVGAVTDHITPWDACFPTVNILGGTSEFVLSSQGHIQALVNPVGNPKASYRTNALITPSTPVTSQEWLETAEKQTGSWWSHWSEWLDARGGRLVNAPESLGSKANPPTIQAPGANIHN